MRNGNFNTPLGKLDSWERIPAGIQIKSGEAILDLLVYREALVRVRIRKTNAAPTKHSYAVVAEPEDVAFTIAEEEGGLQLQTNSLQIEITDNPVRLTFRDASGKVLSQDDPAFGTSWIGNEVTTYRKLQEGERFLGLGEKTGNLDRRGQAYTNWNTDHFGYGVEDDPIYCSTPFFLGVHSDVVYGVFLDNTHKTVFNFGASNNRFSYFSAEDGEMDYYFFSGLPASEIVQEYAWLTGTMPLPPKWALGYQQCRYSYYPDSEVLSVARNFRDRKIPADVIYLDIHYMQDYKVFTFHEDRFPDPKGLMEELKSMGFHVVVIVDPGVKVEDGYPAYESGKTENAFVKYPDGEDFTAAVWPGWSHFPDFTSPKVREWWGNQFDAYTDVGLDGFWNDMNEPAAWGQHFPDLMEFDYEGEAATHKKARNVYGMNMARATYEGAKGHLKGDRPFVLTRAGFSGVQRYAAVWTGDNVATDEHMLAGVRLVNSLGMTGVPFSGYDVGGFVGDSSPDLFARWIAIAAFSPFFRGHSMINSRDAEPWAYGEEVEEISRNYIRLRYQLMPYLYSVFNEASRTGIPVSRSLALEWPHEARVYEGNFQNQYQFGPGFLIAPVESTKEITRVFLPEGSWYDFFRDTPHEGGEVIYFDCPKTTLPVFVRGGAIIPMQSPVQSAAEKPESTLFLHVYKGSGTTEFDWYEDDGKTYDFEAEDFASRTISLDSDAGTLTLGAQKGDYSPHFTHLRVFFHGFEVTEEVKVNGVSLKIDRSSLKFVEPISSFDPLGTSPGADLFIESVASVEVGFVPETFRIEI